MSQFFFYCLKWKIHKNVIDRIFIVCAKKNDLKNVNASKNSICI
jgi:hypothetical protein